MMRLNIFFSLLFFLLFIIPINLKSKIFYDVLKNNGSLQVKIFKLKIIDFKISLHDGYIELLHKKNGKITLIPIELSKEKGFLSDTDFASLILKKIYVQRGVVYINFGLQSDAFLTAMVVGTAKVFTSIFGTILKAKKPESRVKNKIYPSFSKDELKVSFKASIRISIMQVNSCFIKAMIEKLKMKKELLKNEN